MVRALTAMLLLPALGGAAGGAEERGQPALSVVLRPSAAVAGKYVRLAEVAELGGRPASRAGRVLLGPAPGIGRRGAFRREQIARRLVEEGFEPGSFRMSGAAEVLVRFRPEAAEVPAEGKGKGKIPSPPRPVKRASPQAPEAPEAGEVLNRSFAGWVRAALARRLSCKPQRLSVQVSGRVRVEDSDGELNSLEGLTPEVRWPVGRLRLGRLKVGVLLRRGAVRVARLEAYVETSARMEVLVTTRDLRRGDPVLPADLRKAELRLTDLGAVYLTEPQGLMGCCAARSIRAGQPLRANMFKKQKLVRRGQAVTIVSESGPVRVTEKAVAAAGGGLGDVITVKRRGGRPALSARVAGNGLVKVD
jgi:flagella basal body P-ring formation protein FlgA